MGIGCDNIVMRGKGGREGREGEEKKERVKMAWRGRILNGLIFPSIAVPKFSFETSAAWDNCGFAFHIIILPAVILRIHVVNIMYIK